MSLSASTSTSSGCNGQYLHGAEDLRLETRDLAPPAPDEVQVAIRSTILCGSDLHYYHHYRNGTIQVREPLCLGHESSGQIVALGSAVGKINPSLKVDDSVALEVGVPCEKCEICRNGSYNVCPNLRFRSSGSKFPHYQGTLQDCINHPVKWVHKLPSQLDFETGALLEPLSVAIHAVRRGWKMSIAGDSCLILGAGAVGLLCAIAARAEGCENVVMADIDQGRLGFALENGFASTIYRVQPRRGTGIDEKLSIARETAAEISRVILPNGEPVGRVYKTFECTGVESCLQAAVYATESSGCVLLVGMGTPNHTLPISDASAREISLIPTWRYANAYPRAIEIAAASTTGSPFNQVILPDISKLITHRYAGLESIQDAFKTAGQTSDSQGKLVVKTVINF